MSGRERLKTSYSLQHGYKNTSQGSRWGDRRVKPSSRGLMCGTNEDAEDLTGQRAPVASSRWGTGEFVVIIIYHRILFKFSYVFGKVYERFTLIKSLFYKKFIIFNPS